MRSSVEEQFIAWLITQKNVNGTLYKENIARSYARHLRIEPFKLKLSLSAKERNVYQCRNITDFDRLHQTFVKASNYRKINYNSAHGAFSAGLSAYRQYLEHLTIKGEAMDKYDTPMNAANMVETSPKASVFSRQDIREAFKVWLREQHPEWSPNTLNRNFSDAYYLANNDRGVTLDEALTGETGIQIAYEAIRFYFEQNPNKNSPSVQASGYKRSLLMLKEFLAERFPALIGSKEQAKKNENIYLPNGKQIPTDEVIDLDEARTEIDKILRTHFAQFYGYSNKRLLFEAVKIALPMFLNDNGFNDEDTVIAIAKHLLSNKYVFYDLHIWQSEPDYPKSTSGLMVGFGRAQGGIFTYDEAEAYIKKVKIPPYLSNILRINNGKDAFILIDEGKIALTEHLDLSSDRVNAIYAELNRLFIEAGVEDVGYVIPRDITTEWFNRLPKLETGIEWTPLLLQEIILRYPNRGIKIIMSGLTSQRIWTIASAIVQESPLLNTFADVAHLHLQRKQDFSLPKRMSAEDLRLLLRKAGMIAGNELIYNLHKVLGQDHRFAFSGNNQTVLIRER